MTKIITIWTISTCIAASVSYGVGTLVTIKQAVTLFLNLSRNSHLECVILTYVDTDMVPEMRLKVVEFPFNRSFPAGLYPIKWENNVKRTTNVITYYTNIITYPKVFMSWCESNICCIL